MNINILVTGCSGFIGKNFMQYCINRNYNVFGIDIVNQDISDLKCYSHKHNLLKLASYKDKLKKFKPNYIVHLAAETGMDGLSATEYSFNYRSVVIIRKLCKLFSIKKVIFTSSLLVCKNGYIPYNGLDFCPPNGYGHSKALSELYVRKYFKNISWDIIRPTSIWGPFFKGGYRHFFLICKYRLFIFPNTLPIMKPNSFVYNTCFMIDKILFNNNKGRVFYLADYPEVSVQIWAQNILNNFNISSFPKLPLLILYLASVVSDCFNKILPIVPFSSLRFKNMLTNQIYPTNNLKDVVGKLPYSNKDGVAITINIEFKKN